MRRAGKEEFPLMKRLNSSKIKVPPDVEKFVLSLIRPHFSTVVRLGQSQSWGRSIYLFSK
jgi:hypothetical protein